MPTNGKAMTSPPPPLPRRPDPAPGVGSADAQVLASFQETMRAFLDVQRSTMLAYPRGPGKRRPDRPGDRAPCRQDLDPGVRTSDPRREADARPDPLGRAQAGRAAPGRDALRRPVRPAKPWRASSSRSSATGPATRDEMLELDLDLEADLGIDSIKRVEILGTLREAVPSLGESTDLLDDGSLVQGQDPGRDRRQGRRDRPEARCR